MRTRALLRALRPAQWLKNVPVGAGLLFGGRAGDPAAALAAAAAFVAFCGAARAGYLVNDVVDRAADAAHPRKRARPIASAEVPPRAAVAAAVVLFATALAGGFAALPVGAAGALCGYVALTLGYTFGLRRIPGAGPVVVAGGFVLRVLAGALAVAVAPSPWLLSLTAVLALALATAKREAEARRERGEAPSAHRRTTDVLLLAAAAGYLAYALWPSTVRLHGTRALAWTAIPVATALWRFRVLLRREREGRGPAEIVACDVALLALGALWIAACAAVLCWKSP